MSTDILKSIQPVILAGGAGRRLWPLSTAARPKPFLRAGRNQPTLLQHTARRCDGMRPPLVVANRAHRDFILRDFNDMNMRPGRLLLEPFGRGTAPALAFAAHLAGHRDDPLLLVLPSDHRIDDMAALRAAIARAAPFADGGAIVTFGITPHRAETRYGYIHTGDHVAPDIYGLRAFEEKPNATRARDYYRGGAHLWNSGIFLLRAHTALAVLRDKQPALFTATHEAVSRAAARQESVLLDAAALESCPHISIDNAVMEKLGGTNPAMVVPVAMGWSDLGTWGALLADIWRQRLGKVA